MKQYLLPDNVVWTAGDLHQALLQLISQQQHMPPLAEDAVPPLTDLNPDSETISDWLERVSEQGVLEFKETEVAYPDLDMVLQAGAPAILQLPHESLKTKDAAFLVLIHSDKRAIRLLDRQGKPIKVEKEKVRKILAAHFEEKINEPANHIARRISSITQEQEEIACLLLREQLASARIKNIWLIRLSPGDNFFRQIRHIKIPNKVGWMIGLAITYQILSLFAWFQVGQSAIGKSIEAINLQIWGLLLLTLIPISVANIYIRNRLSLSFGMLVRNRLLHGVLKLKPEQIRHKGSSFFFSTLMNVDALEVTGLASGFSSIMAAIQLGGALFILFSQAEGSSQGILLLLWMAFILLLIRIDYQRMSDWMTHQQLMTADLVERMIGHRTRLIQEDPKYRHHTEDEILSSYSALSQKMDSINTVLDVVASRRGWLALSLVGLVQIYFTNQDIGLLLLSLGGILFAADALDQLKVSLRQLISVLVGWKQVRFLYNSGKNEAVKNKPNFVTPKKFADKAANNPIINVRNVSYSYAQAKHKILDDCSFEVNHNDKILLQGTSGSGKSTLASLLAGMMQAQSGNISLSGVSIESLGEKRWHKHVVISPQFHENHILNDTFAFNLLMGRNWPPDEKDIAEAETICEELDLGDLLKKMPAGMQQTIGESGWRLSHGEKSRLFIARTLLQKSPLIILDESFAALDPETLQIALPCVMKRSNALLLIAHP